MVAGQQHLRHLPATILGRPRVLRRLQQTVDERVLHSRVRAAQSTRQLPDDGLNDDQRRKLAARDTGFRVFYEATPFFPFTGGGTARGLRELPGWIVVLGIAITVVLRWFHNTLFGQT